jgi:uncharacterized repeat protein (TIGR03803 family)
MISGKTESLQTESNYMNTRPVHSFLLPALIAGLGLIPAGRVSAQAFTTLYSFTATSGPLYTNSDGANPEAGLILSGNTLYGTAFSGGSVGYGAVFKVNPDGTGFTNLHSYSRQRRSLSGCRIDFIGQHPVWDGEDWRQFGSRHGVRRQHRWHGFYKSL